MAERIMSRKKWNKKGAIQITTEFVNQLKGTLLEMSKARWSPEIQHYMREWQHKLMTWLTKRRISTVDDNGKDDTLP